MFELVTVAGRVTLAAGAQVEVPVLVCVCHDPADMDAARDALAALCRDLDDLQAAKLIHQAQVDAVVDDLRAADEADQVTASLTAARARTHASLESCRSSVQLVGAPRADRDHLTCNRERCRGRSLLASAHDGDPHPRGGLSWLLWGQRLQVPSMLRRVFCSEAVVVSR